MNTVHVSGWNNTTAGFDVNGGKKDGENGLSRQVKKGIVFAGNINSMKADKIAGKREQARKQAARTIMDQFMRDNEITDGMNELRERNRQIKDEISALWEEQSFYRGIQSELKDKYGIEDGSQEQQDIELIQKAKKTMKEG